MVKLKLAECRGLEPAYDPVQLASTIQAFSQVLANDMESDNGAHYCAAVGMVNSSRIAIHAPAFCRKAHRPSSSAAQLQDILTAFKEGADRVLELAHGFFRYVDMYGPPIMSPLVPDSIFQAAFVYAFLWRETGYLAFFDALSIMKRSLEFFGKRWGVAGEYLRLLELQMQEMKPAPEMRPNSILGATFSKPSMRMASLVTDIVESH